MNNIKFYGGLGPFRDGNGMEVGCCCGLKGGKLAADDALMRRMICLSEFATCNRTKLSWVIAQIR